MRCDEFETRLNDLLDERQPIERDPQLRAHTLSCGDCRRLAAGYGALFQGLAEAPAVESDPAIAWRVVRECRAQRVRRRVVRFSLAGLATAAAAALLLAVALRDPPQAPDLAGTPRDGAVDVDESGNATAPLPQDAAPQVASDSNRAPGAVADEPADVQRPAVDHNLALAMETRQTLAGAWLLVPGVSAPAAPSEEAGWQGEVAGELKPLADSTAGALGFLLNVLPDGNQRRQPPPAGAPGT